ncbi:MAG: hypothetical protein IKH56_07165 [Oscillospiraceae bacterium]|nr:hypothetical protein [Oscillospiraceae bacterium]
MNRRRTARGAAVGGIMAALALAVLYAGSVFPAWALALSAVAGLFPAAAYLAEGTVTGLISYAAAAAAGLLLVPDKGCAFLFSVFFGYYAVVKLTVEKRLGSVPAWGVKLLVFNGALTAAVFLFPAVVTVSVIRSLSGSRFYLAVYLLFNVVFILFDIGYSRLISYGRKRILPRLK